MIRPTIMPLAMRLVMHFWASPENTMSAIAVWGGVRIERNACSIKVLASDFPRNAEPETPKPRPLPEFPTDVPAPEPHDVPIPEPIDPPAPDPGEVPPPTTQPEPEKKPRSVP